MFDGLVPHGLQHYWKTVFAKDLADQPIAVRLDHGLCVSVVNSDKRVTGSALGGSSSFTSGRSAC